jgi:hypothetical protein
MVAKYRRPPVRAVLTAAMVCVGLLSSTAAGAQVLVGVEQRRDRFTYRFENPSSIDTTQLVPHFFRQTYRLDNTWLVVSARYRVRWQWETSGGLTPERTRAATDYDTFFDPDGTVWVSGTTGDSAVRSVRFSQQALLDRIGGMRLIGGYRFRMDRADFRLSHKTVTRNGSTVSAADLPGMEHTRGVLHEIFVRLVFAPVSIGRWDLAVDADVAPAAIARLHIRLPEKYPGQDLVFGTSALTSTLHVAVARRNTSWPVEISFDAGRAWNYRSSGRIARDGLGASVAVGRAW